MKYKDAKSRISLIRSLLKPLKEEYHQIINNNIPLDGDLSSIAPLIKIKLLDLKNKIKPYREELVILNRRLMTKEEKREERVNSIGLMKKFFDEGNNEIKAEYGELYLNILDYIESLKEVDILLLKCYEHLDERKFKYKISNEYLNILEKQTELSSIIKKVRILSYKID